MPSLAADRLLRHILSKESTTQTIQTAFDSWNSSTTASELIDIQATLDNEACKSSQQTTHLKNLARHIFGYSTLEAAHNGLLMWGNTSAREQLDERMNKLAQEAKKLQEALSSLGVSTNNPPMPTQRVSLFSDNDDTKFRVQFAKDYITHIAYVQKIQFASGLINELLDKLTAQLNPSKSTNK